MRNKNLFVIAVIMALLFLLMVGSSWAVDRALKFAWDHDNPVDVAEWLIYDRVGVGSSYGEPLAVITNTGPPYIFTAETTLQIPAGSDQVYYFVARAKDASGNESGNSNEISQQIDVEAPGAPITLTVIIEIIP